MKTKNFILSISFMFALLGVQNIKAQAPTQKEDSIRLANTSLFQEYVKSGNYADAVKPWEFVYLNFPSSTAYIYAYGTRILNWQISQAKTEAEKKELIAKLMKLYDDRITYFGTNARQPEPWILGMKALDYVTYHPEDPLKKDAYNWLERAVFELNERTELAFMQQFVYLSTNIYSKEKSHANKYIQDYLKVNEMLENRLASTEDNAEKTQIETIKKANESYFITSGVADCNTLESIYNKNLEANKENLEWLNATISFFSKLKCTESPTYFKSSVYAHKINPTVQSAVGCAEMSYLTKDYNTAIDFFEEAIKLETSEKEKAEYQYKIAQIYYLNLKNFSKSREFCRAAIANNPNYGKPYILIGMMYADSKNVFGDDAILNATVYWAAVDKLERAKQVDSSSAEDANRLIATYKRFYPKKDDVFFKPEIEPGKSFLVGGWINESVMAR